MQRKVIRVPYKCACMQDEGFFEMEPRWSGEPIEDFMLRLRAALSADHRQRNPLCMSEKLTYLKIPVPKGREQMPLGSVE